MAEEIRGEYSDRSDKGEGADDLVALAKEIIPYNMQHNAETEACDLLMEIEQLDLLEQYVDNNSFQRVCLYLTRSVAFIFPLFLKFRFVITYHMSGKISLFVKKMYFLFKREELCMKDYTCTCMYFSSISKLPFISLTWISPVLYYILILCFCCLVK